MSLGNVHYAYSIPVHIVYPNCTGTEETIWDCPSSTQGKYSCSTSNDVSVACHGKACYNELIIINAQIMLLSMLTVLMVSCVYQMELIHCKEELKCAIITFGLEYVLITTITTFYQLQFVNHWVIHMVSE